MAVASNGLPERQARLSPLSVRLTSDERARLERLAGSMSLGAYIKSCIFDGDGARPRQPRPVRDRRTIAQLLARLGASELSAHLGALADAARSGSLTCDPETDNALRSACADIAAIRSMLIKALGLKPPLPHSAPLATPCQAFDDVAGRDSVR